MTKLNPKQERFCQEYIIDLNATQAAIRSGYSKKTAGQIAEQNLKKLEIQNRLRELQNSRQQRTEITADMVVSELAKIAFFDIRKIFDTNGMLISPTELDDSTACAIASIKSRIEKQSGEPDDWAEVKEYKANDKLRALDMLGKHLGVFGSDKQPPKEGDKYNKRVTIARRSDRTE